MTTNVKKNHNTKKSARGGSASGGKIASKETHVEELLEENNRLQKKSLDLLYNMRRMQTVRFVASIIIILLPIIAAFVVLPRFVTATIDDFKSRIDNIDSTSDTT